MIGANALPKRESGESRARDVIEVEQKKGRKITFSTCDVADKDAAIQEAKRIEPHYHDVSGVKDALAE
jgi:hypothetical protein